MEKILCFIMVILGFLFAILCGSLIFWGIGNLFIFAFKINYTWTFLHGFIVEILYILLKEIFNKK